MHTCLNYVTFLPCFFAIRRQNGKVRTYFCFGNEKREIDLYFHLILIVCFFPNKPLCLLGKIDVEPCCVLAPYLSKLFNSQEIIPAVSAHI